MERLTKVNRQNGYVSIDGVEYNECLKRLAEIEDKLESGQALELPFNVGDKVYLVRRNRNFKWVVSRTQVTMYLKHSRLLVKCACDSEWHELEDVFADKKQADARLQEILEKQ